MKTQRLTRAQRREQTRERLLEAARKMFLRKGMAITSVEDIAEAAGYTRGAFYSNFGGKPELLIELLRRDNERARAKLQATLEKCPPDEVCERAISSYSQCFLGQEYAPLWLEAALLACRDTDFQAHVSALEHEKLVQVATHIRMVSKHIGRPPPLHADAVARSLVGLCEGVQLFRMRNAQMISDRAIRTTLAEFLSCVFLRRSAESLYDSHCAGASD
jgi:AcrR family transcriptional regulator